MFNSIIDWLFGSDNEQAYWRMVMVTILLAGLLFLSALCWAYVDMNNWGQPFRTQWEMEQERLGTETPIPPTPTDPAL